MKIKGVALIMLAAVGWGIGGMIADTLLNKGWSPIVISLYRGIIGFLTFFAWLLLSFKMHWCVTARTYFWPLIAGVGVAGNSTFYFWSIQISNVAVAATLMYTAPVFVLLISFLLGMERATWFKWSCVGGVVAGVVLLTDAYKTGIITASFSGIGIGLASALFYALFILALKKASANGKPQFTLTVAFFSLCLVLLVFTDPKEGAAVLVSADLGWFFLLGIVGAGISFILYIAGIRLVTAATASVVAMVEPVIVSLLGVLLLGETMAAIQLLGMAIILTAITVLNLNRSL
ncbi:DMT family transporter [Planococcus sp. FY231025]|uniref:DMT family transporter n=1 Tax=Planococcus sp. FY231025 TaxID=3455699 RepID=UPI003F8E5477